MTGARTILLVIGASTALTTAPARAQNVTPMVYDLAPAGREASRHLEFWNSQNRVTAIEISVARRSYDEQGRAIETDAPADFEILPAQFLVQPGERQKVRVRYVGAAAIGSSATYAISFRQVPLTGAAADPKLRFLFDFKTLANVVPSGAKPDIVVQSAIADGQSAKVTFANHGTRYGRLDSAALRLGSGGKTVEIDAASLRDQYDLRWITPGGTRTVTVPLGRELSGPLTAERVQAAQQ